MILRRCVFVVSVLFFIAIGTAGPASAHAVLIDTDPGFDEVVPSSPENVRMTFNERVELAFQAVRVLDTDAERVDSGDASRSGDGSVVVVPLRADLPQGTYTVTYRVISADSHPVSGAFVFHVGEPGPRPEGIGAAILAGEQGAGPIVGVLYGVVRWINFLALLLMAGVATFLVLVWRRAGTLERSGAIERAFGHRWRRLLVWSWAAAVLAVPLGLVFQAAVAAGVDLLEALSPSMLGEVAGTRFGTMSLVRLGLLVVAAVGWMLLRRTVEVSVLRVHAAGERASAGAAADASPIPFAWVASGAALMVALLATPGLAGHAGTTEPVPLNVALDTVHMASAAAWVGGLAALLFAAFPATRSLDAGPRVRSMTPVVARFSDMAMVAVAALTISGVYRAWVEIQALRGLTDTPYGLVFLAKMALFAPLLSLGVVNNRWIKPALERAAASGEGTGALSKLRRTVGAEVAIAVAVIAVTALLVNLAPARVDAGITGPFITDVALGDNNLNVVVDPNQIGENLVHLTVTTPEGAPAEIRAMTVRFTMPEEDVGPLVGEGREVGPGHFIVQGRQLSIPGEWVLEIQARVDKFTNLTTRVRVTVNE